MLAPYFPPSGRVGAKRALRLARRLAAIGWRMTILTLDLQSSARLSEFTDETLLEGTEALNIVRVKAWLPGVPPIGLHGPTSRTEEGAIVAARIRHLRGRVIREMCLPDPLIGWAPFVLPAALKLVQQQRPHAIFAMARPFSSLVIGWLLSLRSGCSLILDYRDPWTSQTDPRSRPPLFRRPLERFLERAIARRATHVFFASPTRAQHYQDSICPSSPSKVSWLPNAIDEPHAHLTSQSASGETPFILHAGNLYGGRTLIPVLNALQALEREALLEPRHLIVEVRGTLDRTTQAFLEVSPQARSYLRVEAPLSYTRIRPRMQMARALLIVVAPEHSADIPAKIYDYLATERPILCLAPDNSEAGRLIRHLGAGIVVDPSDARALREAILTIMGNTRGGILREDRLSDFTVASLANRVELVLEGLQMAQRADHVPD
ncbi:MAG TPA: glycosyltransferase [Candidatus Polarisedimenticolia bacterium]|nr:glycosyltransferase [Candidatus Polarisedimenticolia bacterium]